MLEGEAAAALVAKSLRSEKRTEVRRLLTIALGIAGGEDAADLLEKGLGDSYRVNREAALGLYRVDPKLAVGAVLARLSDEKNPHARRFAAIVLGRMLDRRAPSFCEGVLLRAGASVDTRLERLLLYLDNEVLLERLPPLR